MRNNSSTIYLVRHGETLWNTEKRWQGTQNSELTALGKQQAAQTRDLLQTVTLDAAYSSPLGRALQTIDIILENRHLNYQFLPAVKEMNMGSWEGRLQSEIAVAEPEQAQYFRQRPDLFNVQGAENFQQLQQRMVRSLKDIFNQHAGQNILIVSHWVAIKAAIAYFSKVELINLSSLADPKNAELIRLSKNHNTISVS